MKGKKPIGAAVNVPNSTRKGWKLIAYVTEDTICIEAEDGKQIQVCIKQITFEGE